MTINTNEKQLYFNNLGKYFEEYMSDYDVARRKILIFNYLINNHVLKGKKILEVGCGTGRFSEEILNKEASLTVLDIGFNLVKHVTKNLACKGTAGSACCLPFRDNTFEFIISSECVEHTPDPIKAIREMCRVCRPEGFVCLTTPNRLFYPMLLLSKWFELRKFSGIEHWIYPHTAIKILKHEKMIDIHAGGCHILPFQLRTLRPILRRIDRFGHLLFPIMINFGIIARKKSN